MARPPLSVRIVSPEQTVYDGSASALIAPAWDGLVGILPGHAPMLALLGSGTLRTERPEGGTDSFRVEGGVIKIDQGQVTVLTDRAETGRPDERIAKVLPFDEED